jgi:hypothetical protein
VKKLPALLVFFLFFLASSLYFLISPPPAHAFSLVDLIFKPLIMKSSTRKAPDIAPSREGISEDSYSNTLIGDTITCEGTTTISKSWAPEQKNVDTGTTDSNGNHIYETVYVDYDANGPIESQMDVKNLSNDYYRNFQTFFARGGIKCTESRAKADFTNFDIEGTGAALRATPYKQLMYYRSQFLTEVAQSLNQKNPVDTVAQDYQIAWSCNGSCQEIGSDSTSSCRPIYVSEIIFGLQSEAIYYDSPDSSPTTFPSSVLTNINGHYSGSCSGNYGCYSSRSNNKTFVPLTKDLYKLMYSQLNFVPKGNVNSKVTVTNYDGYNTVSKTKTNPVKTTFDRNLPAAAAAYSNQAQALNLLTYNGQKKLSNTSICDNVETNSNIAQDQPQPTAVPLYVKGTFQHVPAGQSYSHSEDIEVKTTYNAQVKNNTELLENAYLNLIPFEKTKNYQDMAFSSTTTTNQNNPIPDPGNRADAIYKEMRSMLRPSSWF